MIHGQSRLSEKERATLGLAIAFLAGRLGERGTLDWALGLQENQYVERRAVLDVLDQEGSDLRDPWRSAWEWIEMSWQNPPGAPSTPVDASYVTYAVAKRLKSGRRSGQVISSLVQLVRPIVQAQKVPTAHSRTPRKVRSLKRLISITLTSGGVVDPAQIGLSEISDGAFLFELTRRLDAVVAEILDVGNRCLQGFGRDLWYIEAVRRVYFVATEERSTGVVDPDQFGRGIVPLVKLLGSVVLRLAEVDAESQIHGDSLGVGGRLDTCAPLGCSCARPQCGIARRSWEVPYYLHPRSVLGTSCLS